MMKKFKNIIKNNALSQLIPLLALVFAANIISMEPSEDSEKCTLGESSEYSYEATNPLSYLFEPQFFKLAEYNNTVGSVLPLYTGPNGKLYSILTRESRGRDRGRYDDFGGSKDKGETHPIETAGHEFFQEGILQRTLGWNLTKTIQFLNLEKNNINIIAYSKSKNIKNVTYIVDFDQYAQKLFNNFYDALAAEKKYYREHHISKRHQTTTEKDKIAGVLLNDLKEAIIQSENSRNVLVWANVLDSKTNKFYKEQITLRPFLVIKLRSYFLNMPYEQGENEKIKHYKVSR